MILAFDDLLGDKEDDVVYIYVELPPAKLDDANSRVRNHLPFDVVTQLIGYLLFIEDAPQLLLHLAIISVNGLDIELTLPSIDILSSSFRHR